MDKYLDKIGLQDFTNKVTAKYKDLFALKSAIGAPQKASTVAGMTDTDSIYVYTGSETGYTAGNWYYYDGAAWVSGGVYNAVAFDTDTTLTQAGEAADAKAVGDAANRLAELLGGIEDVTYNVSPNLLDFDDVNFKPQYYMNVNTGNPAYNAIYNCTGFIPVESGQRYTLTYGTPLGVSRIINYICGYDNNKEFIASASRSNADGYVVPENVAFAYRFGIICKFL